MPRAFQLSLSAASLALLPVTASAHPGHLAEVAGHGHWLGAAAIGAAIAIGLFQGLKGRRRDEADDEAEAEGDFADGDFADAQDA